MSDAETTVAELKGRMKAFVDAREWQRFHTPKNLAMSLAIEAAEVMEHFQWLEGSQSSAIGPADPRWAEVRDEVADVLCYLLSLANALGIDLDTAMRDKMARNEKKYPVDSFRGYREWGGHRRPRSEGADGGNRDASS